MKVKAQKAAMQLHEFLADAPSAEEARATLQAEGVDVGSFTHRLKTARASVASSVEKVKSPLGDVAAKTHEQIRSFMKKFGADDAPGLPAGAFARSKGSGKRNNGSHARKQDTDAQAE